MAQPPELEARVAALEARITELDERVRRSEQDVAAPRVPAGGPDRDVTDMRTEIREFHDQYTRVLNAMRQDLTDLRSNVETGFIEIRGRLDPAATGQQYIVDLLNTLITGHEDR